MNLNINVNVTLDAKSAIALGDYLHNKIKADLDAAVATIVGSEQAIKAATQTLKAHTDSLKASVTANQ